MLSQNRGSKRSLSLCLDPLFWECILNNVLLLECILEIAFSRMHFVENSAFGKILKLFIRSDYAEKNCAWLVFLKNSFFLLNNILLVYIM
jgi:hypothetical protein